MLGEAPPPPPLSRINRLWNDNTLRLNTASTIMELSHIFIIVNRAETGCVAVRWRVAALTVELVSVWYDGGYWPPRFCQDRRLRSLICYDAEDPSPRFPLWLSVIKTSRLCCGDTCTCLICCLQASVKNLHL